MTRPGRIRPVNGTSTEGAHEGGTKGNPSVALATVEIRLCASACGDVRAIDAASAQLQATRGTWRHSTILQQKPIA